MRERSRAARHHGASDDGGNAGRAILTVLLAFGRAHVAQRDAQANRNLVDGARCVQGWHCDRMRGAAMVWRLSGNGWSAGLFVGIVRGQCRFRDIIR